MAAASHQHRPYGPHPIATTILTGSVPLFLGALLCDWAYWRTEQVQWINFAAWLNAGAMVVAAVALVVAIISTLVFGSQHLRKWLSIGLLIATLVFGLLAALAHARDGWATMPDALVLSAIAFVLALAATWAGFSRKSGDRT